VLYNGAMARGSSHQSNTQDKKLKQKEEKFASLDSLIKGYQFKQSKGYITQEFQDFGYRLAVELDDLEHKALYIRMAKVEDRGILERALSFVSDADTAKSKARLFMWKVSQLKKELDEKKKSQQSQELEEEQQELF